jgi:hypothetical protein
MLIGIRYAHPSIFLPSLIGFSSRLPFRSFNEGGRRRDAAPKYLYQIQKTYLSIELFSVTQEIFNCPLSIVNCQLLERIGKRDVQP